MPLQLTRVEIQRQNRARVQIVAPAIIPVEIRTGVPGGPVHRPRLRIVTPRQPRRTASVIDVAALPGLRARLAARRNGPEPPNFFAGLLVVRGQESAHSL